MGESMTDAERLRRLAMMTSPISNADGAAISAGADALDECTALRERAERWERAFYEAGAEIAQQSARADAAEAKLREVERDLERADTAGIEWQGAAVHHNARADAAEAKAAVCGGEWCAQNRAEGRGPCGACAWCCQQAVERAERAERERDEAEARLLGLIAPVTCGVCGLSVPKNESIRCAGCKAPFHEGCIERHFACYGDEQAKALVEERKLVAQLDQDATKWHKAALTAEERADRAEQHDGATVALLSAAEAEAERQRRHSALLDGTLRETRDRLRGVQTECERRDAEAVRLRGVVAGLANVTAAGRCRSCGCEPEANDHYCGCDPADPGQRMVVAIRAALARAREGLDAKEQPSARACTVYRDPCSEHGFIHGAEAEELRAGVEKLIENAQEWARGELPDVSTERAVLADDLQMLLDRVDARDSLAYGEAQDDEVSALAPESGPAATQPASALNPDGATSVHVSVEQTGPERWRASLPERVSGCGPTRERALHYLRGRLAATVALMDAAECAAGVR